MAKTLFSKQRIDAAVFIAPWLAAKKRDELKAELEDMFLIEIQGIGGGNFLVYVEDHGWVHHWDPGSRLFPLPTTSRIPSTGH